MTLMTKGKRVNKIVQNIYRIPIIAILLGTKVLLGQNLQEIIKMGEKWW
jgi:hypothetical protein